MSMTTLANNGEFFFPLDLNRRRRRPFKNASFAVQYMLYSGVFIGEWSVGRLFASGKKEKNGFHCMTNKHKTQEVAKKRSKVVELKFDACKNIFSSSNKIQL